VASAFARRRPWTYRLTCALALIVSAPAQAAEPPTQNLCGPVLPGFVHCDAAVVKGRRVSAHASTFTGYGPADIQDAYRLASAGPTYGADQTVAIVDAYDLPTAEADLGTYRSHYGLPPCTTANGCFRKVNQSGGTTYPPYNSGWAGEIALDLDAVSAACPLCHILLVEANSNSLGNLGTAVNRAAAMGATQISNSYGGPEWSSETSSESYYNHPGVAVTVSSGDNGYGGGVEYPAASRYVTAVGGTSLHTAANSRGWSETAWSGAGSGCSSYVAKPSWQGDSLCPNRSVADVSAVADPATGLAVYDSYDGWKQVGGTSAAAPIIAATFALVGSPAASPSFPYDDPAWFNDVDAGSNGDCILLYLCSAGVGFDGPTGIGAPSLDHTGSAATVPTWDRSLISPTAPAAPAPPPPAPAPAVVQPPAQQPLSSVAVSSAAVRASRSGRLTVLIGCGGGPACTGVLALRASIGRGGLRPFGHRGYSVEPGKTASVSLRLSRAGLRLLTQRNKLRVYGTALDADGTSAQSSFMLRAPKPKPRQLAR
jgi:hypothetical protein